jgi:hypothetical protein
MKKWQLLQILEGLTSDFTEHDDLAKANPTDQAYVLTGVTSIRLLNPDTN